MDVRRLVNLVFILCVVAPLFGARAEGPPATPAAPDPAANGAGGAPGDVAAAEDRKPLDKKQIRKLLSAEPDPSLVLEPPPEAPKANAPVVKEPPRRPSSAKPALPVMGPGNTGRRTVTKGIPGQTPTSPEVAIILVDKQFYPSKIRLKEGVQTRLYFTTTNEKAAAVVVEQLQIQRWIAKDGEKPPASEAERARWESAKEIAKNRVTEILVEPRKGSYSFHDVLTGAKGTIVVE